jgi:acetyl-CoA synthetase
MKTRSVFGGSDGAVWQPGPEHLARSRLLRFMNANGHGTLAEFHQASVSDSEWFTRAAADDLEIPLKGSLERVRDDEAGREFPRWFPDATMNVAESCLSRHAANPVLAAKPAIVYEGDLGQSRTLTFAELEVEADRFAFGLRQLGITKGDRVALFMPPLPEAAAAVLGCAKIGAVVVPAFSGYGSDPLAARINASTAAVLVTVNKTTRRGKPVPMKATADEAAKLCPSLRHIIVISSADEDTALTAGRDVLWHDLPLPPTPVQAEAMDPNDPLFIIFTSGTTGAPKGIVHSHIGYLLKASIDFGYAFDIQADDTLAWITDMGWMLGPLMILGGLHLGATIVMIEGLPDYPETDRIWQVVERNRATVLGIAPTAARGLRAAGKATAANLSSLRAFASTGEAWDEPTWHWLFDAIGGARLPIINYTGGTETGGGILSCYTISPQSPASFCGPLPGMDVNVFDNDGHSTDEIGELVISNTWTGMTHGFWQANDRYLDTYWGRWDGVWVHGDLASVDSNGYWHIHGRSDDTLKIGGRRVGPAEIESALVAIDGVAEAAAIGVPDPVRGQRIVAFICPKPGTVDLNVDDVARGAVRLLGKGLAPSEILVIPALPKTRNGKIMRRVIRSRYLGEPCGDLSALDPATSLECIPQLPSINDKQSLRSQPNES